MPIASPPLLVASTAPVAFDFAFRKTVKVQVRFYSDVEGTIVIDAAAGGSRDVIVSTTDTVIDSTTDYEALLSSGYSNGATTVAGATWGVFDFADGAARAMFACSGGTDPGGALSYRVILSVNKQTPPA